MLIWGVLLCLVVWAALLTISRRHTTPVQHEWHIQNEPSALEILNQRYARGELDAAAYEAMRERIQATSDKQTPLMLSFQAAYSAPFVMISQNRQAEKDRLTAQNDYLTDVKGEQEITHILEHLDHQDTLIIKIIERLEAQHEEMLNRLKELDPEVARQVIMEEAAQQTDE